MWFIVVLLLFRNVAATGHLCVNCGSRGCIYSSYSILALLVIALSVCGVVMVT